MTNDAFRKCTRFELVYTVMVFFLQYLLYNIIEKYKYIFHKNGKEHLI